MIIGVLLMRLYEIKHEILEGYKEVTTKFSEDNDPQEVATVIEKYKELVNRNQFQGQERNIDWWGKQGYDKFKEAVRVKSLQKSMTQIKRSKNKGRSITLEENDKWLIVVPLDKDASCFHGKDTEWCTTKPFQSVFEDYFYVDGITVIYFILKTNLNKWAISVDTNRQINEYFDKNDNKIDQHLFDKQTGLSSDTFIQRVTKPDVVNILNKSRGIYKALSEKAKNLIKNVETGRHNYELEEILFKLKSYLIGEYFAKVGKSEKYDKKLQKAAMNLNGFDIRFIINPDKSVQLAAINDDSHAIKRIDNPYKDVQLLAVNDDPLVIEFIDDPDKDIQIAAIKNNGYTKYTKSRFSPEVRRWAKENGYIDEIY
jgi:hypothetical protein